MGSSGPANPSEGPLSVGEILRAGRVAAGLSLEELSGVTRIRAQYLDALERFDLEGLPSRPFTLGFVRNCARALDLDAEAIVARFREEAPPVCTDLQAPVKVERSAPVLPRLAAILAGIVVLSVIGWNIWRRTETRPQSPPEIPVSPSTAAPPPGATVAVGPPPPTVAGPPPSYQTPGLAAADSEAGAAAQAGTTSSQGPAARAGAPFVANGRIYGATDGVDGLVLQAKAPVTVIVRDASGGIVFAQELQPGEAWRAPKAEGLSVDVDSPGAVEAFVGGYAKGALPEGRSPLARLMQ